VKTEDAMTTLAEKVDVQIVIIVGAVAMAQFILQPSFAIFDGMHQMMLAKEHKTTENAALVYGENAMLQVGGGCGMTLRSQSLEHNNTVARRLDAMLLKQLYAGRLIHIHHKFTNLMHHFHAKGI